MRKIGIIGGMSPESTEHYYAGLNKKINELAGGQTSADLVLRSVNFEKYYRLMGEGQWGEIEKMLADEVQRLSVYYDCKHVAIATNTMHKVAKGISDKCRIRFGYDPLIHIGDCIADECEAINAQKVLLLGTKFTMLEDFMAKHLDSRCIEVINMRSRLAEVNEINRIIFDELCHGEVSLESKGFFVNFVQEFLDNDSAEKPDAVILGCTELNMILRPGDVGIPIIDSTQAHINKLVQISLS